MKYKIKKVQDCTLKPVCMTWNTKDIVNIGEVVSLNFLSDGSLNGQYEIIEVVDNN